MDFNGVVIAITGAAGGIGSETARQLAARGAALSLSDADESRGLVLTEEIRALGAHVEFFHCDICDSIAVGKMLQGTVDAFGRLDVAVNNAGIAHESTKLAELDDAQWEKTLAVNLTGVFFCMRGELAIMLRAKRGTIVNVGSLAGLGGAPGLGAYSASKHGVVALTRTAALEYARKGIRVNAVCPSYTRTSMVENIAKVDPKLGDTMERASPMRRLGEPQEIAHTIVWLCSEQSSFVNGQAIPVDGGITAW